MRVLLGYALFLFLSTIEVDIMWSAIVILIIVLLIIRAGKPKKVATIKKNKGSNKTTKKDMYGTIRFKYRDYDDNITERTVDIKTGKKGDTFSGFCHLRKENRTFYFTRISGSEVVNVTTGEVTTPMTWRHQLQGTSVSKDALEKETYNINFQRKIAEANETWLSLTMPLPEVEFKNKRFALGGYFESGNIEDCKAKVEKNGGIIQIAPNGKTDYIVVNPSVGVNQTYEKAIHQLRKRGIPPVIISEEHWLSSMETQ